MITDIKEKLADMQVKYIDKQSAEVLKRLITKTVASRKLASLDRTLP